MNTQPPRWPVTFPASTSAGNALSEANRAKTEADRAEAAASAGQATTTTLGTVMLASSADAIDMQSVRPLRARLAGTATAEDERILSELEARAAVLRAELATLV